LTEGYFYLSKRDKPLKICLTGTTNPKTKTAKNKKERQINAVSSLIDKGEVRKRRLVQVAQTSLFTLVYQEATGCNFAVLFLLAVFGFGVSVR
jgi:hypothetical protein